MQYDDIVRLVFKCINFGVFVSLFIFIFRRKIVPLILKAIAQKQAFKHNREIQYATLKKDLRLINKETKQQEEKAERFEEKIAKWKQDFDKNCFAKSEEEEQILKKIEKRKGRQQNYLTHETIKDEVVNIALVKAKKQLKVDFESQKSQKEFLALSIGQLERVIDGYR